MLIAYPFRLLAMRRLATTGANNCVAWAGLGQQRVGLHPVRHVGSLKSRCRPSRIDAAEPWACVLQHSRRGSRRASVAAASGAAPAAHPGAGVTGADGTADGPDNEVLAEQESLDILEWPAVSRQVRLQPLQGRCFLSAPAKRRAPTSWTVSTCSASVLIEPTAQQFVALDSTGD